MKGLLNYFKPSKSKGYLEDLIIKYFIYQVFGGLILLFIVMAINLITQNENYLVSLVSEAFLGLFLIVSLLLLKYKSLTFAGNIFYIGMVAVILVAMNSLDEDVTVLFKYLHGFYTVVAFLVGGAIFSSRSVIVFNAILILITTTRVYLYSLKTAPEQAELFTSGYTYHTVSLIIITVVLFFIKKFYEQTARKINMETQIIENQNVKLLDREVKLSNLNRSKDKFLSIIAHDLKSPIASILSGTNLLSEKFDTYSREDQKRYIDLLNESSQNTYNLLDNLLIWASSQQGLIDFKPKVENLSEIIEESLKIEKQIAFNKNVKISNSVNAAFFVNVDKNMVLTVFRNLISNAIKFTPKQGSVTINAILVTLAEQKEFVQVSIADTGVGIEEEVKENLFEISQSISSLGTEGESGTGLGLGIAKDFIHKHGGSIWVESDLGKGSNFIFTLPK